MYVVKDKTISVLLLFGQTILLYRYTFKNFLAFSVVDKSTLNNEIGRQFSGLLLGFPGFGIAII